MSGGGRIDGLELELMCELRDAPLDLHLLAMILVAVTAELTALMRGGLVHGVTVESGGQAWGLTVKRRTRLAG